MVETEFKIVWWNAGMAPPISSSVVQNDNQCDSNIIRLCLQNDIVILGEYRDISYIRKELYTQNRDWIDCCQKDGHLHFTNGFFFNKKLIEVVQGPISLVKSLSGGIEGNYRIAQHLIINHKSYNQKIALYIVHWTQYGRNEDGFNKTEAAFNLSCDIKGMEKSIPFVVCIGDFNVEPYSEAFSHMGVSREREYTVKRGGLYNPFWKYLADSGTINYENHCTLKCSTPTFDQILLNQNILLSDAIIKADVLSDFNNPLKGEHWPIRLVLTFLHEPQEISI